MELYKEQQRKEQKGTILFYFITFNLFL